MPGMTWEWIQVTAFTRFCSFAFLLDILAGAKSCFWLLLRSIMSVLLLWIPFPDPIYISRLNLMPLFSFPPNYSALLRHRPQHTLITDLTSILQIFSCSPWVFEHWVDSLENSLRHGMFYYRYLRWQSSNENPCILMISLSWRRDRCS